MIIFPFLFLYIFCALAYVDLNGQLGLEPGELKLKIEDHQKSMICFK